MTNLDIKKDLLSQLFYEADAYKTFHDIEKLVENGLDLSMIPVQPLYVAIQSTAPDQVANLLPRLSTEQRQALRDLDIWQKDELDAHQAFYWLSIISKCDSDEVKLEYFKSEDFLLSIKNKCIIQTFDVEDPLYPEHDRYFLTEDHQLLIEYTEDFLLVSELKEGVKLLYSELGPENAYAFLFKMVVDSYLIMEEESFSQKKERLRDLGFVDYYEALEYESVLRSEIEIDKFIKSRKGFTADIDVISLNQSLHSSSLSSYRQGLEDLKSDLEKIVDSKRQKYLHFNFLRLVNARMTLDDALRKGSIVMAKAGHKTKQRLELGFDYVKFQLGAARVKPVLEDFDFFDLYRVGNSLIENNKKKVKKILGTSSFDSDEFSYFLGMYWNAFLENSFEDVCKYKFDGSSGPLEINSTKSYRLWIEASEVFMKALPFIQTFFKSLQKLKEDGHLNDQFYLNYEVDNIDFEAIIISSFINFVGGHYNNETAGKMGVSLGELVSFYHKFFNKKNEEYLIKGEEDPKLREETINFIQKFGFDQVENFDKYLYQVMVEQLNGYEIDSMTTEDFKHIGGPIILNISEN